MELHLFSFYFPWIEIHGYHMSRTYGSLDAQLQKLLIARSLISEANLIFLDEPLDALDADSKTIVTKILKTQIKEKNKTIFIITHHIEKHWLSEFNRKFTVHGTHIKDISK